MMNFNAENLLQRRFNALNTRVTELQHLIAIGENNVVVLLILKSTLIMGRVLAELMLTHQITINQKFDGIVKRCSRHAILLILHPRVKHLHIKMPTHFIYLSENGKTLRRLPVLVHLEVTSEDIFYAFLDSL